MQRSLEVPALDFDRYPRTGNYFVKRASAYIADVLLCFVISLIFLVLIGVDMTGLLGWVLVYILTGLLSAAYKLLFDGMGTRTLGKAVFSLRVVGLEDGPGFGEAALRNLSVILPFIGPLLDQLIGNGTALDSRQKLTDHLSTTLVVEDIEEVAIERPMAIPPPPPKEKMFLDYRNVRVGNCPRCGAPYRVLAPGDSTFSGLWNHRCTWCNHLIRENE
ncbi:MAG: RDD family protein [Candidatus Thermoplasmatota archaeon]|jgi:uncharacterized RDD family membrane protein YckC|nr:RDD family protein [Candidatus Thermoplasmatota archaeon]